MARDDGFGPAAKRVLLHIKMTAKRLGKLRHLILHGVMRRDFSTYTGWLLQVREFDKATSNVVVHRFSNENLHETLSQMSLFLSALSPWVAKLIGRA